MAKKHRPKVSRYNPVPLYRSYGVTKKENIFTALNEYLAVILGWLLYIPMFAIIIIGTLFMIKLLGSAGILFVFVSALLLVYFVLARKLRKRARFILRLRKLCKKMGYVLEMKRGFLKSLKFNKDGIDLVIHTPTKKWFVRFMTTKKRNSHVTFLNKDTIEIKKIKGRIKLRSGMFGYMHHNLSKPRVSNIVPRVSMHDHQSIEKGSPKLSYIPYSFNEIFNDDNFEVQKALVVNPVPLEMFKTDKSGSRIPIDTGERLFDYIMFSGSGFLNTLEREYQDKNGEQ